MLLAIDTSAGTSAAVVAGELKSLVVYDDPFGHAENIGLAIRSALADAKVKISEISGVVIGRGPAPYTGLRVGMAAGLGIAGALGLPTYGVMIFDAVAHSLGTGRFVLSSDAKRRELFIAAYDNQVLVEGPSVMAPDQLDKFAGFEQVSASCDAGKLGLYAEFALAKGIDLSDVSALYLRSPDVSPSAGKKVSG